MWQPNSGRIMRCPFGVITIMRIACSMSCSCLDNATRPRLSTLTGNAQPVPRKSLMAPLSDRSDSLLVQIDHGALDRHLAHRLDRQVALDVDAHRVARRIDLDRVAVLVSDRDAARSIAVVEDDLVSRA